MQVKSCDLKKRRESCEQKRFGSAADENPKIRKKITRVKRTANDVADTAKYMFK